MDHQNPSVLTRPLPGPRRLVAAGLITRRAGRTVTTVRTSDGGRGTVANGGAR